MNMETSITMDISGYVTIGFLVMFIIALVVFAVKKANPGQGGGTPFEDMF